MAYKWMPVVSAERCTGCGLCVDACGPRTLEMLNGIAALMRPETCGSEEHCIAVCRDFAIEMAWLALGRQNGIGKWTEAIENGRELSKAYPKPVGCSD